MHQEYWHRIRNAFRQALERGFASQSAMVGDDLRGSVAWIGVDGSGRSHGLEDIVIPTLADRYDVQCPLGAGGMATVFSARDLRHDRQVAIKILKREVSEDLGAERFLREIKIAAGLRHPHILPLYDSGEVDGVLYYVMPVESSSLRERLTREGALSVDESLRLAGELSSALDYAHAQGIVHRDIKPENILLSQGHAVIADFGIARAIRAASGPSLTRAGLPIGSPAYMSPEQIAAEVEADARSDLYSLALVLYEMVTGAPVFSGPNAQALLARRLHTPLPDLSFPETVPESVSSGILAALSVHPARRPATGAAFVELLTLDGELAVNGLPATPRSRGRPVVRSIAVLPFANSSVDPDDEYLSDGLTDETINALAQFPELRVAARTSCFAFKGSTLDVGTVAARLGVDAVLEGSVRRAGTRLRVTVQLVNAANGYHIWSQRYDRDSQDVFAMQDEITKAIVDRLKLSLATGRDATAKPPTTDVEAYHLYLKGRHLWNKRSKDSLVQAVRYFDEAIRRDPQFALAYSGIADAYLLCNAYNYAPASEAMPRVQVAVERALELDESLAEAHASSGLVSRWKRDWVGEEAAYRRAIALNPSYPTAHQWYATHLAARGRFAEALSEIRRAEALDPLSHAISVTVAVILFLARDYDGAIAQLRKTMELEPNFASVHAWLGILHAVTGDHDAVERAVARARELAPDNGNVQIALAYSYAVRGRREQALEVLRASQEHGAIAWTAMIHIALGDRNAALEALERGMHTNDSGDTLYNLKVFPWLDPLRTEPRFQQLLERLGIPD